MEFQNNYNKIEGIDVRRAKKVWGQGLNEFWRQIATHVQE